MGEFVEHQLESLLPVFEQLQNVLLLSSEEVQGLVKRCRRYEYRLQKREKSPQDYFLYCDYLNDVVTLIRSRRVRQDYWHKRDLIDRPLLLKIGGLHRLCCDRFQANLEHWRRLITFLDKNRLRKQLSKAYTRVLQVHGRNVDLRVESALWEFFTNASVENARSQLQLAIRMSPEEYKYYAALFRVEVHFVEKIMLRKQFLQKAAKKARDEKSRDDGDSDIDDSVFDMEVNDAILQLRVPEVVLISALRSVSQDKAGEMMISMWSSLAECKSLQKEAFERVKVAIEERITGLMNEDTQRFHILQAVLNKEDELDAYERAVDNLPTEKMHRMFLAYCERRLAENKDDPLAEMKRSELLAKILEEGWATERDAQQVASRVHDVIQGEPKELLQKALKSDPKSAVFWTEWLQYRMENEEFETETQIQDFMTELNTSFKKVEAVETFPLWELALDFAISHTPNSVEEIFDRAFKTAAPAVASRVKIVRLGYLKALLGEGKITQKDWNSQVRQMINQKPNESDFYLAVAEQELSDVHQCDHSLVKLAYNSAINENGTTSGDVWLEFIRYSMKHDPSAVAKLYQRAMLKLHLELCAEFLTAWTVLQQEQAADSLQKEKQAGKRTLLVEEEVAEVKNPKKKSRKTK